MASEVEAAAAARASLLVPVDWLEERSGLVGGLKYFLFRNVPRDTNWFHTLGSATLTAFIVQTVTGVVLAFYYKPSPNEAYDVDPVHHQRPDARLARPRHAPLGRERLHHPALPAHGARLPLRRLQVPAGAQLAPRRLLLVLAMLEGFTGYLLPWDQTAYWATVVGINLNATAPFLGPFLSDFLRGGQEIGTDTLSRFYSMHMLLIPGGLIALIALHLYLVIRLGVTSPPWSKEAAAGEREEVITAKRGLVEPRPRGDGGAAAT